MESSRYSCRHCGEPIERVPDYALGPAWVHVGDGQRWEWCRFAVAEPVEG